MPDGLDPSMGIGKMRKAVMRNEEPAGARCTMVATGFNRLHPPHAFKASNLIEAFTEASKYAQAYDELEPLGTEPTKRTITLIVEID